MTTKTTDKLKKITGQTDFPFVSNGVAAADANGYVVNEDALVALIDAADAGTAAQATIADQALQAQQAVAAQQAAEAAVATANTTITTHVATIATLTARVEELESESGIKPTVKKDDVTEKGKVPAHLSASNTINQLADSLIGAPKEKAV